jgi:hypothetical protein
MQNEQLILETLMEIKSQLGQVSSKVETFASDLKSHVQDDKVLAEKVSRLENNQNKTKWFIAGVSATVSIIFSVLSTFFHK